jgi:TATA-binding protein-associated factor
VEDIWSIMNFSMPQFLGESPSSSLFSSFLSCALVPGEFSQFNSMILKPIKRAFSDAECASLNLPVLKERGNGSLSEEKQSNVPAEGLSILRSLHKQILPFLLRRTKTIALPDLPPKIVKDIYCPLSKQQRLLYASYQRGLRLSDELLEQELLEHLRGNASASQTATGSSHPFQALAALKKICLHPSLVLDEEERSLRGFSLHESGKLCRLVLLLIDQEIVTCPETTARELEQIWRTFQELPSLTLTAEPMRLEEEDEAEESEEGDSDEEVQREEEDMDALSSEVPCGSSQRRKKCLIFAEHRETLDIILEMFAQYFPSTSCLLMDGRTPAKKRAESAIFFNSEAPETPQILLLTTSSCGLGLNLSAAEIVIFVEHSWNPFVDLQAMDRVHRLGQVRTVSVFKLLGLISPPTLPHSLPSLTTCLSREHDRKSYFLSSKFENIDC